MSTVRNLGRIGWPCRAARPVATPKMRSAAFMQRAALKGWNRRGAAVVPCRVDRAAVRPWRHSHCSVRCEPHCDATPRVDTTQIERIVISKRTAGSTWSTRTRRTAASCRVAPASKFSSLLPATVRRSKCPDRHGDLCTGSLHSERPCFSWGKQGFHLFAMLQVLVKNLRDSGILTVPCRQLQWRIRIWTIVGSMPLRVRWHLEAVGGGSWARCSAWEAQSLLAPGFPRLRLLAVQLPLQNP